MQSLETVVRSLAAAERIRQQAEQIRTALPLDAVARNELFESFRAELYKLERDIDQGVVELLSTQEILKILESGAVAGCHGVEHLGRPYMCWLEAAIVEVYHVANARLRLRMVYRRNWANWVGDMLLWPHEMLHEVACLVEPPCLTPEFECGVEKEWAVVSASYGLFATWYSGRAIETKLG